MPGTPIAIRLTAVMIMVALVSPAPSMARPRTMANDIISSALAPILSTSGFVLKIPITALGTVRKTALRITTMTPKNPALIHALRTALSGWDAPRFCPTTTEVASPRLKPRVIEKIRRRSPILMIRPT
jgi:hypothetical protein